MKPPFRLVPDKISTDTVGALQYLLRLAESGEIIGMAFVAMSRRRHFIANTTGEAHRSPVFTRGMLAYLDDKLADGSA